MLRRSSPSSISKTTQRLMAVLVAIYWLALVVSTHLPGRHMPDQLDPVDKFLHLTAYAGLAFLILLATRIQGASRTFTVGLFAVLAVHGILDEWTQGLVPGRFPSVLDAAADSLGAGIGILMFAIFQPLVRRMVNHSNV